jgi:hypothetical protein
MADDLSDYASYESYLASQPDDVQDALNAEFMIAVPSREQIDSVITQDFLHRHFLALVESEEPTDLGYGGSGLYSSRYASYLSLTTIPARQDTGVCYQSDAAERAAQKPTASPTASVVPTEDAQDAALGKLQTLFNGKDGYYPRTLAILERELAPNGAGTAASIPKFSVDLFASFLQGWLKDPMTAAGNVSAALRFLGVPSEHRPALTKSLSSLFYQTLSQAFGCAPGERLQDNVGFIGFTLTLSRDARDFSALATRDGNPEALVPAMRKAVEKLASEHDGIAAALSRTESSYAGMAMDSLMPGDSVSEPLGAVRDAILAQKENVTAAMRDIASMDEPGDIAHLIKTFEGDARDVAWIYGQIGIPQNPETGRSLVEDIVAQMNTSWDWRHMRPEFGFQRADIPKPANVDWPTWALAFQIAREKKKIELGETAFMAFAIGGSIAATIAGAVVAGPAGGIAAGTFAATATGLVDVHNASERHVVVDAANAAHHMADLPIARDEHLEIVSDARDYAVDAAIANVLLSLVGGTVSPALSGAAKTLVPGSKLARLGLSAVLQGLYGAADGAVSAMADARVTNQEYLDRSAALSRPGEDAPSSVDGLIFSATVGGLFGMGAEAGFGSIDVIFRFGAPVPQIVESGSGRILGDFRISPDGTHLIGPDGRIHPIAQRGGPRLIVKENAAAGAEENRTAEPKRAATKEDFNASMRAYIEKHATLSANDFHRLFDGLLSQANVGNCYLISAFNALRTNPVLFETLMRTSITILPDGSFRVKLPLGATIAQVITIHPWEISEQWNKSFLRQRANGRRDWRPILWGPEGGDGFKILEAAFCKMQYGKVDRSLIEGGSGNDVLHKLMGNLVGKKTLGGSSRPLQDNGAEEAMRFLNDFDPDRDLATVGTRITGSGDDGETVVVNGRTFALNHSYSIKQVDKTAKTVTVLNPWNDNEPITLTYDEFLEVFTKIESVEIDYSRVFGRVRFD